MRIQYDETALENEYLLTSRKTGYVLYILVFYNYLLRFAMSFLYEHALNIIHYQATFQAMASHYDDFHLGRPIFFVKFLVFLYRVKVLMIVIMCTERDLLMGSFCTVS